MSRGDYVDLVRQFCDEVGLDDVAAVLDQGVMLVDDTLVGLEYLDEREEVRLLVDLGEPQVKDPRELMTMLLQANLGNTSPMLPTFSLHPATGHPIVALHIPMSALLANEVDLVDLLMERIVSMLDEWRLMLGEAFGSEQTSQEGMAAGSTKV
jgi:hypothetical protein